MITVSQPGRQDHGDRVRILLISSYLGRPGSLIGGGETYAEILGRLLGERGHVIFLGCWQEGMVSLSHISRQLPARQTRIRSAFDPGAILRLVRIIKQDRIGLVIANSPKEYWPAVIASKLTGTNVILIRHLTRSVSCATRLMINLSVKCIIAVSQTVKKALLQSGIKKDLIRVITNGVPYDEISACESERDSTRAALGFCPGDIVIGFAGRLQPEKGLAFFIKAFSVISVRFPGTRLLIVGEGPERRTMQQELIKRGLGDRALFTGRVEPVYRMYAAMDIFVMPSVCDEAFGFAAAEAMSMGRPVIASAAGGLTELITDGTDGILVPPGDTEALAAAMVRLIENPEQARAYAAAGRDKMRRGFSDVIQGNEMDRLIISLSQKKGTSTNIGGKDEER
jgi:glycosyltransferase involved in cell wall biosynthesis